MKRSRFAEALANGAIVAMLPAGAPLSKTLQLSLALAICLSILLRRVDGWVWQH